jgi:tetratricopeptide (TPR) repeat protein
VAGHWGGCWWSVEPRGVTTTTAAPKPTSDCDIALGRARALQTAGKWSEADAAVDAALAKWPRDRDFLILRASLSHRQNHWQAAHERYADLRAQHPGHPFGWSRDAEMLRQLKQTDAAEELLSVAVQRFPQDAEVLTQRVLVACDLRLWPEAEERGFVLLARLPDSALSYRYASEAYARQERYIDAELIVAEGLQLQGFVPALTLRFAELASLRKDWRTAARRWRVAARQLPDNEAAHCGLAAALLELGRLDDQEAALAAACQRLPGSLPLAVEHARAASARNDWAAAVPRWRALLARNPNDARIRQGIEHAVRQSGLPPTNADSPRSAASAAVTVAAPAETRPATPRPMPPNGEDVAAVLANPAKLLLCFESVGVNCELGLAQRRAGVEPLGLLRFAGITLDRLLLALDSDLEGVGDPTFTRIAIRDGMEYMITDTRYGLNMHTFTAPKQVSMEQMAQGTFRRLQFLARKLRDDLQAAEKIFVRTSGEVRDSPDRIMQLHRSLCRHADNTLLYVGTSPDPDRIGHAEWLAPGVMLGWVEEFSVTAVRHDQWRSLCRAAYTLWTDAQRLDQPVVGAATFP